MKLNVKKYGYLYFVILIVLIFAGGYLLSRDVNDPIVQVSSHSRQYVRHEKGENRLTAFEKYLDQHLSAHFSLKKIRKTAMIIIIICLIVLILQPPLIWLIYRRRLKPPEQKIRRQAHPFQGDRDAIQKRHRRH